MTQTKLTEMSFLSWWSHNCIFYDPCTKPGSWAMTITSGQLKRTSANFVLRSHMTTAPSSNPISNYK